MGFFSELKNDLSQAVNTLMPDDKLDDAATLDNGKDKGGNSKDVDIDTMLSRLDDFKLDDDKGNDSLESFEEEENVQEEEEAVITPEPEEEPKEAPMSALDAMAQMQHANDAEAEEEKDELSDLEARIEEATMGEIRTEEPQSAIEEIRNESLRQVVVQEIATEDNYTNNGGYETMDFEQQTPTDEIASITEGMAITGDIQTTGSLDLIGKVTGNIKALGKLNVTGEIIGDSDAAEIYAEAARITGEIRSKGSVKVGQSTVIVGNIFGSSAVIAGAVKGDIDVHGPVVLDTTAIVMGNIKSQSVQINNGAVIEGMCSQAYADVNPSEFFETLKNR